MKENELPSFAELGVDVEDFPEDNPITQAEEFFNTFADKHYDEIPEELIKKISIQGGFIDCEPIDIDIFKCALYVSFVLGDVKTPEEYVKNIFGMDL